jgi:ribose transport system ATP-binding protein
MAKIGKTFVGIRALRSVDLELFPGEVHGLLGENGAGKSKLMRILAGMYSDYSGQIFFRGQPVNINTPRIGRDLGIAMVHQELRLVQISPWRKILFWAEKLQ